MGASIFSHRASCCWMTFIYLFNLNHFIKSCISCLLELSVSRIKFGLKQLSVTNMLKLESVLLNRTLNKIWQESVAIDTITRSSQTTNLLVQWKQGDSWGGFSFFAAGTVSTLLWSVYTRVRKDLIAFNHKSTLCHLSYTPVYSEKTQYTYSFGKKEHCKNVQFIKLYLLLVQVLT